MYHYRKTRKIYSSFEKPKGCTFCMLDEIADKVVEETPYARVIRNRVSYDVWELRDVIDHLMIVPKRHAHNLEDLNDDEKLDIMHIMARYEAIDYNMYARSARSVSRSIAHQHTHLIKTGKRIGHGTIFLRKPYFFVKF
jgi:diadenosine tetraphosphate (Ap4A) HIT family hydrolase